MDEQTVQQFLKKLRDCIKEYKNKISETRDDIDAAFYFDGNLRKFLEDNQDELDLLGGMNFEKSFMSWLKNYLFGGKKNK